MPVGVCMSMRAHIFKYVFMFVCLCVYVFMCECISTQFVFKFSFIHKQYYKLITIDIHNLIFRFFLSFRPLHLHQRRFCAPPPSLLSPFPKMRATLQATYNVLHLQQSCKGSQRHLDQISLRTKSTIKMSFLTSFNKHLFGFQFYRGVKFKSENVN